MNLPDSKLEPMDDRFRPVASDAIQALESRLGASLPKKYIQFLECYGGCGFSGDATVIFEHGQLPIFTFFDGQMLKSQMELDEDLTADGKLAIADELTGNTFVLDCRGGGMYFRDFSENPPSATKVANSFDGFLNSIQVEPFT